MLICTIFVSQLKVKGARTKSSFQAKPLVEREGGAARAGLKCHTVGLEPPLPTSSTIMNSFDMLKISFQIVRNMRLLEELLGILQSTFGQALESEPTALKSINPLQRRKKYKGLMHSIKVLALKYRSARCCELKCSRPQFCCEHIV